MTTPDVPRPGTPGELTLVNPGPTATQAGTPPLASPGVGLAATRVPSGPTLPDPDPASLLLAVSRLANELFAAPPSVPEAEAPESVTAVTSGVAPPTPTQPSPTPPSPTPTAPASPFSASPDFSGLLSTTSAPAPASLDSFRVPLLDDSTRDTLPTAPAPTAAPPAPTTAPPAAPTTAGLVPTFQVEPLVDVGLPPARGGFDAHALKREFPILQERVHGKQLVWLDNAATTQKPRAVIDRISTFYERENSNIHRAAHALAARATDAYEAARDSVKRFVNASSVRDVVFVRGTTEGINLVAWSWGRHNIVAGDEIVVTHLEHHANIVPWQMLAKEKGARLRVAPVDDRGQILLDDYERLLNDRTKLVSLTQVSNALGTVTPAREMIELAKRRGIKVLLDGAQSVSHMRVDLQQLQPDFFVFSGHKVFGPTGIGVVVAPAALLDEMPPWQGGGNMIQDVTFERTIFQPAPARFEAGTGNIADAVGLGAALEWVTRVGIENIGRHEHDLLVYGTEKLLTVPGLRMIGTAADKAGVLSFVIAGHETQALSAALDKEGIAVRGGHHCAQPILRRMGLESTVRASLAPYNTFEDLDALVDALCRLVR
jgi:cysteine desulfurase/selenocysteine lyase